MEATQPTLQDVAEMLPPEHPTAETGPTEVDTGSGDEDELPELEKESEDETAPRPTKQARADPVAFFAHYWLTDQMDEQASDDLLHQELCMIDLGPVNHKEMLRNPLVYAAKRLDASIKEVQWKRLSMEEKAEFEAAMATEVGNVLANEAVRALTKSEQAEVDPARVMGMRWLLTWKLSPIGRKAKARLVILGYQHPDLTKLATAAPTIARNSRWMLFATVALHGFLLECADASGAFLQAEPTQESNNIFAWPTAELAVAVGLPARDCYSLAVKIRKAFYGLTNAPRDWWLDISAKLKQQGWRQMTTDKCVWCLYAHDPQHRQAGPDGWRIVGIIGTFVDDFLIGGDRRAKLYQVAREDITELYKLGRSTSGEFTFAGTRVIQRMDMVIEVDMAHYVETLVEPMPLSRERAQNTKEPATAEELSLLRGVCGTLQWYGTHNWDCSSRWTYLCSCRRPQTCGLSPWCK